MRRKAHIHTAADTSQNNTRTDGERATEGRIAYIQQTTHETDSAQKKNWDERYHTDIRQTSKALTYCTATTHEMEGPPIT